MAACVLVFRSCVTKDPKVSSSTGTRFWSCAPVVPRSKHSQLAVRRPG